MSDRDIRLTQPIAVEYGVCGWEAQTERSGLMFLAIENTPDGAVRALLDDMRENAIDQDDERAVEAVIARAEE